jgi:hypothetical protein
VYSNLAKDQRDIAAANARYRISRQTIFCSATIPQRLDDFFIAFYFFIHFFVYLFSCFFCLFIYLFIYLFVYLFICLFIYLFIYLCIHISYSYSHSLMLEMIFFHCMLFFNISLNYMIVQYTMRQSNS